MRVPTGSIWLLMSTAELSSNLRYVPSVRRTSFFVRTTTAFMTSPFFTFALGMASLTDTTITSPTVAVRLRDPPSTPMQDTFLAPELSAAFKMVRI